MKVSMFLMITTLLMGSQIHEFYALPENHGIYAQTMYVSETTVDDMGTETVMDDEGTITLVDGNGHKWIVEQYPEDYFVGDYVAVILDDNGTLDTIFDDKIIELRATGFTR